MLYKKKLCLLLSLIFTLAVILVLTVVFDPERQSRRAFALLDGNLSGLADAVEISGSAGQTLLIRENNTWVLRDGLREYPVKQGRVEDLFAALTRKGIYPLRARSPGAGEKLGLAGGSASRILVRGGAGLPLLDLLVGGGGALGREVYLSKAGEREIFSGEDRFTVFTDSPPVFWYDLRLFSSGIETAAVQQAEISLPKYKASPGEWEGTGFVPAPPRRFVLHRSGMGWIMQGNEGVALDALKVEAWLRSVLEAEGEDFAVEAPAAAEASVILRLGDGTSRAIEAGLPDAENRRSAGVSGTGLVYVLSEWTYGRLFRERAYFRKQPPAF